MSYDVQHSFWHFWQPGLRVTDDSEEYHSYLKKAKRATSIQRMLLLALAMDAIPIPDVWGRSELALCYTSIGMLAERLHKSDRTIQRLVRELEKWGELEVVPCSGYCQRAKYPHHGTNHYHLPLPDGAEPWGREGKRRTRRKKKTTAEQKRTAS